MTRTAFQDDFDREVVRQAREAKTFRCNDRDRANGTSKFFTCLECFTGPCKLTTPTQVEPAGDEEIAYVSGLSHGPFIAALVARIKVEREQTIKECAEIAATYKPLGALQTWEHATASNAIYNIILALLTNKGEQR